MNTREIDSFRKLLAERDQLQAALDAALAKNEQLRAELADAPGHQQQRQQDTPPQPQPAAGPSNGGRQPTRWETTEIR